MSEKSRILRAAGGMSLVTGLSRILGYLRDAISAALFGAGIISDAFFVAYRIPNMLRELFAEGALSAAFIPALARKKEKSGALAAWRLAALMLNALIVLMVVIVLLGESLAEPLVKLLAPGFAERPGQLELTVTLTRVMFPFIAFMSLAALFMGMLNAHGRFVLPAFAPVAMNLVMIATGLLLCRQLGATPRQQMMVWAGGALAGGLAQLLVQVPPSWRLGFRPKFQWPFSDSGVREVLAQMIPAVAGLSVIQVNLLVNQHLASKLEAGSISWLYYGNRLMQLPLGVFGVAVATAVLPSLALRAAEKDNIAFGETLGFGLRVSLVLTLPAAAGLALLAVPINELLFSWGRFSADDAHAAAAATVAYALGICFASFIKILAPAFYALRDSKTPVKVAVAMVALNLFLSLSLMGPLRHVGLALSVALTSVVNAMVLYWLMLRRMSREGFRMETGLAPTLLRSMAAVAVMVLVLKALQALAAPWLGFFEGMAPARALLAAGVLGQVAVGAVIYIVVGRMVGLNLAGWWRQLRKVPEKAS